MLEKLKKGELNMLVSTAVTEEGLDLTQCQLVVRFDLPDRPVDYIQSRGRARASGSRMVLMVEDENEAEHTLIEDVRRCVCNLAAIFAGEHVSLGLSCPRACLTHLFEI